MAHLFSCLDRFRASLSGLALLSLVSLAACSDGGSVPDNPSPTGTPLPGDGATDFISEVPMYDSYAMADGAGGQGLATGGESAAEGDGAPNAAERAITEADIIKLDGDVLYALSSFSGLSVVDVSQPSQLKLIGNLRFQADPFEMYLEGSTAYVMFNDYGSYERDEENQQWVWVTTSRMQAIDVSRPEAMKVLGDQAVAGSISDSRKVGDVIYLVTHQDGYCWRCDQTPTTRITSFDAGQTSEFRQLDQVAFQTEEYSWGPRSVSVTAERAYVSGWSWSEEDGRGTIDVVDISDPSGKLTKGVSLAIAGQIQSRWQMEEYGGVLRVISQPGGWGTTTPPVLETFDVKGAHDIERLAALALKLPRPEVLRSVRFDGERAYAVTFEQTDPLFTFDLSNPAAPKQVGELEIPGWVSHMEPRGDVIYALGFDPQVDNGSLHVSLFDVSTLSAPKMLDRVNFGGDWGNFAEDQDRIHKAFSILPEHGLILVPFTGHSYEQEHCDYSWTSGIQLVDFTTDGLSLRGVAKQLGEARRSFMLGDVLVGVSEHAVQAFNIANRDAPKDLDMLETARNVNFVKKVGDDVVRFGRDWWTDRTILDITSPELVAQAEPLSELDLTEIAGDNGYSCQDYPNGVRLNRSASWSGQIFVHGRHAFVPRYESVNWESEVGWGQRTHLTFYVVDLEAEGGPQVLRRFSVAPTRSDQTKDAMRSEHFSGIVQTDQALLVGRSEGHYYYDPYSGVHEKPKFSYDVIDLRDADKADVVSSIEVPSLWSGGGWSVGVQGCSIDMGWGWWGAGYGYYGGYYASQNALVSGDIVASQHLVPLEKETGRVRYYLDRIDVSDPTNPVMLDPINIPGQLVHYDHADQSLVTVDYVMEQYRPDSEGFCRRGGQYGELDGAVCRYYFRRLNSLELTDGLAWRKGMTQIDDEQKRAASIAVTDSRVFFVESSSYYGDSTEAPQLVSIAIDGDGYMSQLPGTSLDPNQTAWWGQLQGRADRVFISGERQLTVVDTSSGKPRSQTVETSGWSCESLDVSGRQGYCAQGQYGATRFELD